MLTVGFGIFSVSLDTTVNVGLPAITQFFATDIRAIQWIIIAFVLTNGSLQLTFGRLSDMLGHQRVFTWGLVVLVGGLGLCGVAQTLGQLVLFRAVQAVGTGMVVASGPALLTETFPTQRGKALGLMAMAASLGLTVGPLLGGILVDSFGWRSIFLGRVPLAGLGAALALAFLRPREARTLQMQRFDLVGASTGAAAVGAFFLAINQGRTLGWLSAPILGALALAGGLGALFLFIESRVAEPVLPLNVLRRGPLALSSVSVYLSILAQFAVWLLMPFYLVEALGSSAQEAGLLLMGLPLVAALTAPGSGWLSDRFSPSPLVAGGLALESLALWLLGGLDPTASPMAVVWRLALLGLALGLFQAPNSSALLGALPQERQGLAGGVMAMMRTTGIVTGVAVSGAVYEARLDHHRAALAPGVAGGQGGESWAVALAFRDAFTVSAAIAAAALLLFLVWSGFLRGLKKRSHPEH